MCQKSDLKFSAPAPCLLDGHQPSHFPSLPFGKVMQGCRKYRNTADFPKIEEGMEKIFAGLEVAEKDYNEKLMVMFVGAFSAGKSTLINSILGEERCDTGPDPTTKGLDFIDWHGVSLVDTPGLDAMHQKEDQQTALEAARRANVAVVVTNANQALRKSELPLLKELLRQQASIVVAVNYWNLMTSEEKKEKSKKYVENMTQQLLPDEDGLPEMIYMNHEC